MDSALERCLGSAKLGGLTLRNRLIKASTYEGMTPGGVVSDRLGRFHVRLAAGGIGMTTVGYCAVEADGRLNENMLHMHEGIGDALRGLTDAIHEAGAAVCGQMGHGGGFSKNKDLRRKRPLAPSRAFNLLGIAEGMFLCDAMDEAQIDAFVGAYGDAARFMKQVGFDALEIHFGHGYALCQFISPKTNRRKDRYGGSLINRMRVPLRVLDAVRDAVGDDFPILGKMSLSEHVRGGLHIDESLEVAAMLDKGGIDALIPSTGTSTMSPMRILHGKNILPALIRAERNPAARVMMRLAGPVMFSDIPYEDLYLMERAKRLREKVECAVVYVGGATGGESFAAVMREGFDFIQLGRCLLSDPDLPKRLAQDAAFQSRCNHCNECIATIEHPQGIHCTQFEPPQ